MPAARLHTLRRALSVFGLAAALGGPSVAQTEMAEEVDPYTKGKPELIDKAGYVSLGEPFYWAAGVQTSDIDVELGGIPMLWAETAHFKIGSNLPPYTLATDQDEKSKIKDELKRLKKRIGKVKPTERTLDRWLLLHLYAQRLEEHYAEFMDLIGVDDDTFPPPDTEDSDMGNGPYLGANGKFLVVLLQKKSSYSRILKQYVGRDAEFSLRHYFDRPGSYFFGTCQDFLTGSYENDTALHCTVVYGLTQSYLEALRGQHHEVPTWVSHGMSAWFLRRVDPRFNVFGVSTLAGDENAWHWQPRVRGRVKNEYYPSWEDMMAWKSLEEMDDAAHMMSWSRIDFLMQLDPKKKKAPNCFFMTLKDVLPRSGDDPLFERQMRALPDCFGMELEELDEAWAKYVMKKYSK